MGDFSHLDEAGQAAMVDTTAKSLSKREAVVSGKVKVPASCVMRLNDDAVREIIHTARLAGIQGSKQTAYLIPLCHSVPLTGLDMTVIFDQHSGEFLCTATAKAFGQTGVEMEAFTAVSVASLTIYDMVKAVAPETVIGPYQLERKQGGKVGVWERSPICQ